MQIPYFNFWQISSFTASNCCFRYNCGTLRIYVNCMYRTATTRKEYILHVLTQYVSFGGSPS